LIGMGEPTGANPGFYWRESLNVETYDLRHPPAMEGTPVEADVAFFRRVAEETGGPILELACGTGRVAFTLAEAGLEVTGLDRSEPMLAVAHEKLDAAPPQVAERVTLVHGDMTAFDLGRTFGLIVIAFRSFQSLLTPELQADCLRAAHAHLRPGGRLVLDLFDPLLDKCAPGATPFEHSTSRADVWLPNGHLVRVTVTSRDVDPLTQVMRETWRFTETDPGGTVVRVEDEDLRLRWTYRHELRYLLALSGFSVEAEYSDFVGSPPAYGKELVVVARRGKRGGRR
jgi:SAM-dependent methyltransferase